MCRNIVDEIIQKQDAFFPSSLRSLHASHSEVLRGDGAQRSALILLRRIVCSGKEGKQPLEVVHGKVADLEAPFAMLTPFLDPNLRPKAAREAFLCLPDEDVRRRLLYSRLGCLSERIWILDEALDKRLSAAC